MISIARSLLCGILVASNGVSNWTSKPYLRSHDLRHTAATRMGDATARNSINSEALRIFDAQNGEIDILISDMKMPGMDGCDAVLSGHILATR
jgi:CheY-like chemotaxis protein